jgi:glutamyl-tRNA(Gln) amidotransferase subunit D
MNLACAVHAASGYQGAGVFTCLHGTTQDTYCDLIPGTRVRKMHSSRRDAFRPINARPVASVYPDGRIESHVRSGEIRDRQPKKQAKAQAKYDDKVEMLYTYPGMDVSVMDHFIRKGVHGIVIAATGLGNVPKALFPKIEKAKRSRISVVITTQTLYGKTHELVYSNLRELSVKLGCIFVSDMLPEVAFVKLGFVLGQTRSGEKIKEMMQKSLSYEISDRISAADYLN